MSDTRDTTQYETIPAGKGSNVPIVGQDSMLQDVVLNEFLPALQQVKDPVTYVRQLAAAITWQFNHPGEQLCTAAKDGTSIAFLNDTFLHWYNSRTSSSMASGSIGARSGT